MKLGTFKNKREAEKYATDKKNQGYKNVKVKGKSVYGEYYWSAIFK